MRALYMVPEGGRGRLSAMTFIDEEIHALRARGIDAHVLAIDLKGDEAVGGVHKWAVKQLTGRHDAVAMSSRWVKRVPWHTALGRLPELMYFLRAEAAAVHVIRQRGIQLIHSHFGSYGGLGGSLAAQATGIPLIASLRGMDLHCDPARNYGLRQSRLFDANLRLLLSTADRTIYHSDYMRELGIALGAPRHRTRTILKGVDLERFLPAADRNSAKQSLGLSGKVILTVGNLLPRKGMDCALKAFAMTSMADTRYVICGDGPERPRLEALVAELGIPDRVTFTGRVSREVVAGFFAAADVFVMTSDHEAAGNVYLEAQASGTPVIASDNGGPPEYIENGCTGFLVPYGDPTALADKLAHVLSDTVLRARMSVRARTLMEENFSLDRMTDDFIELYGMVIADHAGMRTTAAVA